MLPALPRLPDVQGLIDGEDYFILHAPRQSGKTTAVKAFVDKLNADGSVYAMYCSLQQLQGIIDAKMGILDIVGILDRVLSFSQVDAFKKAISDGFLAGRSAMPGYNVSPLLVWLTLLCSRLDKDLVIFFDEADCLQDLVLLSFLSQIRDGYVDRAEISFPSSIALIGMRNIRDYKARVRPDSESLGSSSPFNIIAEALTLANFTEYEVKTLYAQHTEATGQVFDEEAVQRAWYWSEGQPWLVNALARQVVEKILANEYSQTITAQHIDEAADNLMKRRDTHIDSLLARLHEPRVKRFIEPMLAISDDDSNEGNAAESYDDDLRYCLDLGLIKETYTKRIRPAIQFTLASYQGI
jgi:hypothetical protein